MVFRPYAQVAQAICGSALLRTSTAVSSGFVLPTRRSRAIGWPRLSFAPKTTPLLSQLSASREEEESVSLRLTASSPQTRPGVALLGPCFKTGSARTRLPPPEEERTSGRAQLIQPVSLLCPTLGTARFPHGTRTLSVSETYVSLGGKHHPFTVHYQPLLLSAGTRAASESRAITGPPHFTEGPRRFALALPTAPAGFRTGTSRFARRYSGRRVCFRFLPLLICLSSGSSLSRRAAAAAAPGALNTPVTAPFGHRGLRTSPVAPAFRILLRPSSLSEPTDPPTGLVL